MERRFRLDLYYRLSVFTVRLPPLDDRLEDVPLLAQHFIDQFNEKHSTMVQGLTHEVLESLQGYEWPGNVRELRNVMERAVILARQGRRICEVSPRRRPRDCVYPRMSRWPKRRDC